MIPPLVSGAAWRIVAIERAGERAVRVRFRDGAEGLVRFSPAFFRGVFAHLVDAARFDEIGIEMGAVTWPGELDLAPDRMHADILRDGECILP